MDFGARYYDPWLCRWISVDPMASKYISLSPFTYCGDNPFIAIDPTGLNWYSYYDADGNVCYKYVEGQLSREEIASGNYTDLGFYYLDEKSNTYYSLFGKTMAWTTSDGAPTKAQLYNKVDQLVVKYATSNYGSDVPKVDFFIEGLLSGVYPFEYNGIGFTSIKGTVSGTTPQDGTIYRAVPREMSCAYEKSWQDHLINVVGYNKTYPGYWLQAANNNGVNDGFRNIQIKFSEKNAESFLNSCNKLFGTRYRLKAR